MGTNIVSPRDVKQAQTRGGSEKLNSHVSGRVAGGTHDLARVGLASVGSGAVHAFGGRQLGALPRRYGRSASAILRADWSGRVRCRSSGQGSGT